jgi:hypothetical protein
MNTGILPLPALKSSNVHNNVTDTRTANVKGPRQGPVPKKSLPQPKRPPLTNTAPKGLILKTIKSKKEQRIEFLMLMVCSL